MGLAGLGEKSYFPKNRQRMKTLLFFCLLALPLGALSQHSQPPTAKETPHYTYIEVLMPYNEYGTPGKPFLHIGEIAKNFLTNWRDMETVIDQYQSTMDVLNYLDEQGFELTNRVLFTFPDGVTESFILRKPR